MISVGVLEMRIDPFAEVGAEADAATREKLLNALFETWP
jgi:hypothetical protein